VTEDSTALGVALGAPDLSARTLEDAVTDALRDAIVTARFLPGAELKQAPLAELLGVSRIPLRDALHRLEAEGLVEIDGRRGARVSTLSAKDVDDIYELRILLEPEAARQALAGLDDAGARELLRLSDEMDRVADEPNEGQRARDIFYGEMYRRCGNPRLASVIQRLREDVSRYHLLSGADSEHAHNSLRKLLKDRDAEGFAAALRLHLEHVRDDLTAAMRSEQPAPPKAGRRRGAPKQPK
jgi:DNA-binding GntR family transcriptional regulator